MFSLKSLADHLGQCLWADELMMLRLSVKMDASCRSVLDVAAR
jgi:hypothetical protein